MTRKFWWPKSLADQLLKVKDIKEKIGGYALALGLSPADVTAIENICDAIQGAQEFRLTTEGTSQSVTEWRDQVFYGEPKGDAVSAAPVFAVKGVVTYTRGSVNQLFEWRDNIITRPGYTEAIGEDLGFIGPEADAPDLGTFQPTLVIHPAQTGFGYTAVIGNRGGADQWELQVRPASGGSWTSVGSFTGKSADLTYNAPDPNDPVQLQFRAQLKKNNENYGQLSEVATATLVP